MSEMSLDGLTYKVKPVLATNAMKIQVRLMKMVGNAADELMELQNEKDGVEVKLGAALIKCFGNADPNEFVSLANAILENVQVMQPSGEYRSVDINADFTGKMSVLYKVIFFAIKDMFGDFFGGSLGGTNTLQAAPA